MIENTANYLYDVSSVFLKNRHLARVTEDETLFYGTDHQGSTVLVTDETGTMVWTGEATPFSDGIVREEGDRMDIALKYTGKDLDEDTGLYYFNARWYDAGTGRFITEDPARDGQNWYSYVSNNPLKFVDPTGMTTEDELDEMTRNAINDRENRRDEIRENRRAERQLNRAERNYQRAQNARTWLGRRFWSSRANMQQRFGVGHLNNNLNSGRNVSDSARDALAGSLREYFELNYGGFNSSLQGIEKGNDIANSDLYLSSRPSQYDPIYDGIMDEGCHFLAALGVAHTAVGEPMMASTVNLIRDMALEFGLVANDMSVDGISNVVGVIDLGLLMLGSRMSVKEARSDWFKGANASILYGETINNNMHYREGNGSGRPIWDSVRTDDKYISGFQTDFSSYRTRFFRIE